MQTHIIFHTEVYFADEAFIRNFALTYTNNFYCNKMDQMDFVMFHIDSYLEHAANDDVSQQYLPI